ncbi:MAG: peptide deformylase [Fusobacterium sp. JB021]|nr:peptide deformylase [Fusobacterium sp. JB020]MDP0494227.1 peptide deformylase [Fusobacterium sp. JB021]MDP0505712.1 peptide deformylase [Fusobacterium sp. JB019]
MIYEIRTYGDPCLSDVNQLIVDIDDNIKQLLDDMLETMYKTNGVGLAAPQIGINKQLFVIDIGDGPRKIINPEILEMSEECNDSDEGCLSVPGIYKKVKRADKIKVKYLNENGDTIEEEMEGFLAKAFQHENDHLNGVLFVDRISPLSRRMISKKLQLLKKARLKNKK